MRLTPDEYKRMRSLCDEHGIHTGYEAGELGHFSTAIKRIRISDNQFVTLSAQGKNELVAVERVIELIGKVKVEQ